MGRLRRRLRSAPFCFDLVEGPSSRGGKPRARRFHWGEPCGVYGLHADLITCRTGEGSESPVGPS